MRFAKQDDVPKIEAFLGQADVPYDHIARIYPQVMLLEDKKGIKATIGYERSGDGVLLRSLVLSNEIKPFVILGFLQTFFQSLYELGVKEMYLLVNKQSDSPLFHIFGFRSVEKVPANIAEMPHFQETVQKDCIVLNCQLFTELSTFL